MNSKKIFMTTIVLICLFAGLASAQMKLAYVNSVMVLSEYQPYLDSKKQLESESDKYGAELQSMTENFQTAQQNLEQQALLLSDAKKKEKAQELQDMAMKIQQFQQEKWGEGGELANRERVLLQPVIDKVNTIIRTLGKEGDYDFIFDAIAGNLLHAKESHDITQKVIDALKAEK